MRVPISISMREDFEVGVAVNGEDVSDAVERVGLTIDPYKGPILFLELKVVPEVDLPGVLVEAVSSSGSPAEFLAHVRAEEVREHIQRNGDFATDDVAMVLAYLRARAEGQ